MDRLTKFAYQLFQESITLKEKVIKENSLAPLSLMAETITQSIQAGGKLMLCGNGGSAADAQHLAAELLIRLQSSVNREAIPAIALTLDSSSMTGCGNDFGFECYFERAVCGLGKPGDILLGITTSGRSKNILRALEAARARNIKTLGFLGSLGGPALPLCDIAFVVPSDNTNRIQESHITAGHILMQMIEMLLLERGHISYLKTDSMDKTEKTDRTDIANKTDKAATNMDKATTCAE